MKRLEVGAHTSFSRRQREGASGVRRAADNLRVSHAWIMGTLLMHPTWHHVDPEVSYGNHDSLKYLQKNISLEKSIMNQFLH